MADQSQKLPLLGVRLKVDIEVREGARGTKYWARVRWQDPLTNRRVGVKRSHPSMADAEAWIERRRNAARTGYDEGQTLATYLDNIGDRWTRGIDPTSTYDPYAAGLRRRVLPTLGHFPVAMITAGLIDRAIDEWELQYGRSRDGVLDRRAAGARRSRSGRPHCAQPGQGPRPSADRGSLPR